MKEELIAAQNALKEAGHKQVVLEPGKDRGTIDIFAVPAQIINEETGNFAAVGILKDCGLTADLQVFHCMPEPVLCLRNVRSVNTSNHRTPDVDESVDVEPVETKELV